MDRMVVKQLWVPGQPVQEVRQEAVQLAMDSLRAMGLSVDEVTAVICALQGQMMAAERTTVMVTATALQSGGLLSSRTVAVDSPAPGLVTVGVEKMVLEASPALWSEILLVLEGGSPPEKARES